MHRRSLLALAAALCLAAPARADMIASIARVQPSVLIVGGYKETNNPRFSLAGTGFVVGDGNFAVTNAHVIDRLNIPADYLAVTRSSTLRKMASFPG